jgi:hypothetical protein
LVLGALFIVASTGCVRAGFDLPGDPSQPFDGQTPTDLDAAASDVGALDAPTDQAPAGDGPVADTRPDAAPKKPGDHVWSDSLGTVGYDYGHSVAVDPAGNIYLCGRFKGTFSKGGKVHVSAGMEDGLLISYDPGGKHRWTRTFGGTKNDVCRNVVLDALGQLYIVGEAWGPVDLGGGLKTTGAHDVVLASYTSAGTHRWSKLHGSPLTDYGIGIAVSGSNIFICGDFQGSASFGGPTHKAAGLRDLYVASFQTSNGGFRWSHAAGSTGNEFCWGAAVDAQGNAYVAGQFDHTISLVGASLTSKGLSDLYVASIGGGGNLRWAKSFGGVGRDAAYDVATAPPGTVFVTGGFDDSFSFGGPTLINKGQTDVFLASLSSSQGAHQWSKSFGGIEVDQGHGVAFGGGNVYLAASFRSTASFGGAAMTSKGSSDIAVASFTIGGVARWSNAYGTAGLDAAYSMVLGSSGPLLVTGTFGGPLSFGGKTLPNSGLSDIFLLKLVP